MSGEAKEEKKEVKIALGDDVYTIEFSEKLGFGVSNIGPLPNGYGFCVEVHHYYNGYYGIEYTALAFIGDGMTMRLAKKVLKQFGEIDFSGYVYDFGLEDFLSQYIIPHAAYFITGSLQPISMQTERLRAALNFLTERLPQ